MALILTEEEQLLKTATGELMKSKAPIAALRKLRDTKDPLGYSKSLWQEMANMGLAGLTIPEAYGGMGFSYVGLGQVLEECGRTLVASPLVSTGLLSAAAIQLGGDEAQKTTYLSAIAKGEMLMTLAIDEGKHHHPENINTTIANGKITGEKTMVLDGNIADKIIVAVKDEAGHTQMVVVDAKGEGVVINKIEMMDSRNMANIRFSNVTAENILKNYAGSYNLLENVLDIGRIGLAAEMLGGIQEAFSRTITYLKERTQFGVPIGSFQALQHRAADMFGEIELCKSVVVKSLKAIDENHNGLPRMASLAKAKLGETYKRVSNEGIQMYGGIGMTDDEEIGFFLKRARVVQHTLGDTNFHLDRLAKMKLY